MGETGSCLLEIRRTFDAEAVNAALNDGAIRDVIQMGRTGDLDATILVASPKNVTFLSEHGGVFMVATEPREYEVHTFFRRGGAWAKAASAEVLKQMFHDHEADRIVAHVPAENRACRLFARWMGFQSLGMGEDVLFPGEPPAPVEHFVLERV